MGSNFSRFNDINSIKIDKIYNKYYMPPKSKKEAKKPKPDPPGTIRCPYVAEHKMHEDSFLTHLIRCKAENKHEFEVCHYNNFHVIHKSKFKQHLKQCEMIAKEKSQISQASRYNRNDYSHTSDDFHEPGTYLQTANRQIPNKSSQQEQDQYQGQYRQPRQPQRYGYNADQYSQSYQEQQSSYEDNKYGFYQFYNYEQEKSNQNECLPRHQYDPFHYNQKQEQHQKRYQKYRYGSFNPDYYRQYQYERQLARRQNNANYYPGHDQYYGQGYEDYYQSEQYAYEPETQPYYKTQKKYSMPYDKNYYQPDYDYKQSANNFFKKQKQKKNQQEKWTQQEKQQKKQDKSTQKVAQFNSVDKDTNQQSSKSGENRKLKLNCSGIDKREDDDLLLFINQIDENMKKITITKGDDELGDLLLEQASIIKNNSKLCEDSSKSFSFTRYGRKDASNVC